MNDTVGHVGHGQRLPGGESTADSGRGGDNGAVTAGPIRIRLLGPVDVAADGEVHPIAGTRRRAVLATLALRAGDTVSVDRLIDVVWGPSAPATAVNTVQSHISFLRRQFNLRDAIVARHPGYRLQLDGDATDLAVATGLIERARQTNDLRRRVGYLDSALALWRGDSLEDARGQRWLDEQAERLERLRLGAVKSLVQARLALGEHAVLVHDLPDLAAVHRFDEELHGYLMLALYRAGRQSDALAVFRQMRRRLADELGIDPGKPLRELHEAILRQDGSIDIGTPATGDDLGQAGAAVPAQLPPGPNAVVGRSIELKILDDLLTSGPYPGRHRPEVSIVALSGPAGVGKTTLAVHWARRAVSHFPDGQLYVDLGGYGGDPVCAQDAIRGFLTSLGVPPATLPTTRDALVGLYRTVLAGRQVLVVLDNARDTEHVRPLLPGAGGSVALITSRSSLAALTVSNGAHALTVEPLDAADSYTVLEHRLGRGRLAAARDAADAVIARCGGLPLALALVAARTAIHPELPLDRLAADLSSPAEALDALTAGDPGSDLRTVLSWSLRPLGGEARDLFAALCRTAGDAVTVEAAAAVAGLPPRTVRPLLVELAGVHLIASAPDGRYTIHPLVRAFGATVPAALPAALTPLPHHRAPWPPAARVACSSSGRVPGGPERRGPRPGGPAARFAASRCRR